MSLKDISLSVIADNVHVNIYPLKNLMGFEEEYKRLKTIRKQQIEQLMIEYRPTVRSSILEKIHDELALYDCDSLTWECRSNDTLLYNDLDKATEDAVNFWQCLVLSGSELLKCNNGTYLIASDPKLVDDRYDDDGWYDWFSPDCHIRYVHVAASVGNNTRVIVGFENKLYTGASHGDDAHMEILYNVGAYNENIKKNRGNWNWSEDRKLEWIHKLDALIDDRILSRIPNGKISPYFDC